MDKILWDLFKKTGDIKYYILLKNMNKSLLCGNNDNIKYIKLAQENNEEAMESLIKNNSGLVWNIVKRFIGRGYEAEDLYQIGSMGLIKAIKRFDVNLEVQLSTYAVPYIMGEIKRFIRDDGIIKVSRQTKELAIKIKQIQNEYMNKNGEEISIIKISEMLDIPKEEIAAAIESSNNVDSIYSVEGTNEDERILLEKIADNKDEYNSLVNKIAINEMIESLDEKEKQVVLLRYYREQTQAQVGKTLQ